MIDSNVTCPDCGYEFECNLCDESDCRYVEMCEDGLIYKEALLNVFNIIKEYKFDRYREIELNKLFLVIGKQL